MAYLLSPIVNEAQTATSGVPLSGGLVYTYQAGSTTPTATYTDSTGATPQANPIVLNTYGLPPSPVWLIAGVAYKIVVKDALGNTIRTVDMVRGINDTAAFGVNLPSDGTFSFRNRLHNGNFAINQRAVTGTVTLAAGAYGHDRWKAGASGCTYTFAAVGADTVITVTAGSLLQIVEAGNVEGGVYTMVNRGTAQARYAVNGAATSGGYFTASTTSPLQLANANANQTVTVEFGTGTIDRVQLEAGTVTTAFERRPMSVELGLCQRYYQVGNFDYVTYQAGGSGFRQSLSLITSMRTTPTLAATNVNYTNASGQSFISSTNQWFSSGATATVTGACGCSFAYTASADL